MPNCLEKKKNCTKWLCSELCWQQLLTLKCYLKMRKTENRMREYSKRYIKKNNSIFFCVSSYVLSEIQKKKKKNWYKFCKCCALEKIELTYHWISNPFLWALPLNVSWKSPGLSKKKQNTNNIANSTLPS